MFLIGLVWFLLFVALEWVRPTKFGYGRVFAWFGWVTLYVLTRILSPLPWPQEFMGLMGLWGVTVLMLPAWWIVRPLIRKSKGN